MSKDTSIMAIKGFDKDLKCRDFQFEIGQTYSVGGNIRTCENGFHSCPDGEQPHAVFQYYAPGLSRFCEVEASGKTHRDGNKIASASITIGVELTLGELMAHVAEWCVKTAKGNSNSGYGGAASSSGYNGAASNSGYYGAAFSHALNSRVMCEGDGQVLCCTEFADDGSVKSVASGITGKKGVKAGVWYHCKNGRLVRWGGAQ